MSLVEPPPARNHARGRRLRQGRRGRRRHAEQGPERPRPRQGALSLASTSRAKATGRASPCRWPARIAARTSSPRSATRCWSCFDRGDVRFPYVIGSLWNGKDKTPSTNTDGKNDIRIIKSRTGHKLTFDDGTQGLDRARAQGRQEGRDRRQRHPRRRRQGQPLQDRQQERRDQDRSASGKLTLKAPNIEITATGTCDVKAGGTLRAQRRHREDQLGHGTTRRTRRRPDLPRHAARPRARAARRC